MTGNRAYMEVVGIGEVAHWLSVFVCTSTRRPGSVWSHLLAHNHL